MDDLSPQLSTLPNNSPMLADEWDRALKEAFAIDRIALSITPLTHNFIDGTTVVSAYYAYMTLHVPISEWRDSLVWKQAAKKLTLDAMVSMERPDCITIVVLSRHFNIPYDADAEWAHHELIWLMGAGEKGHDPS